MNKSFCILILFLIPFFSKTQDIRGGEMYVTHLTANTYSFDIRLYTRTSMGLSHDSILFNAGDGSSAILFGHSNNQTNDVTEWQYSTNHTYLSPGFYLASVIDSFRLGGILNITSSFNEPIILQQFVFISPGFGHNTSPSFGNSQLTNYTDGISFFHNPMAFDPDGDSLVFSLAPASSGVYTPPNGSIDPYTGLVQIAAQTGDLAINIQIEEFRNGILIGKCYREMLFDSKELGLSLTGVESTLINTYPNPVGNRLIIERSFNSGLDIIIHDISGKLCLRDQLDRNKDQLDLSSLKPGTYFIGFTFRGKTVIKKLIKL